MATELPPFLTPLDASYADGTAPYMNAVFPHDRLGGSAHTLWWPSTSEQHPVLIFIPGNPGLVDFYTPFLSAIHQKSSNQIAILAHAQLGHTPGIPMNGIYNTPSSTNLAAQVESVIEVVDAVISTFGTSTRVTIAAHSVGSYISLQALKARPDAVSALFLLFPTISHIALTPNGRSLSWLFRAPIPRIITWLSRVCRFLPLSSLSALFPDWPLAQVCVLQSLLSSPSAVYACLTMAHDEMETIKEPDALLLQKYTHRLHMYFADLDGWVGEQKHLILKLFDPDNGSVKVFHGRSGVPHAFCINHGEEVAEQCYEWLLSGGLI